MSKLHKVRLSNFAVYSQGKQVDVDKQEFERKEGYERFIRIVDYTDTTESPRYIKNDTNFVVSTNDIIMIRYGSKTAGMAVRGIKGIIANNMFKISFEDGVEVKDTEGKIIKIDKNYVFHYLRTNTIYEYLHNGSGSSTMPAISFDLMDTVFLYLPEYNEQVLAGKVLNSIFSKIRNNNKINAELESMAKTLYDYWFLQFEFPNEEGKPYKSSSGKMVWNEELKREIPEGWDVGTLSQIADITMGSSPKGESLNDEKQGIIFYQGKTDFGFRFPVTRMYTTSPVKCANVGDILLSVRAPVGSMNIANEKCCIGRGLAAISGKCMSFLYYMMLANQFQFDKYNNGGTTFGAITKDDLFGLKIIIPNNKIIQRFNDKICHMDKLVEKNEKENKELVELRDFLLPLLMNGQVGFKG